MIAEQPQVATLARSDYYEPHSRAFSKVSSGVPVMGRMPAIFALSWIVFSVPVYAETFVLSPDPEGISIHIGDQMFGNFTRYIFRSGAKPILWPVIGPTGKEMTRGYPMRDAGPKEAQDHVHQRSFWFTHGDVNGISFWHEEGDHGTIEHQELVQSLVEDDGATIVTRNHWIGPDGTKICEDVRTLRFGADEQLRWIDFDIVITASEGPITFGDTKEGSFGVRVAGSMDVNRQEGGRIVTSEGLTDTEAWGKRAAWVDYSGPVDDEIVGITIMNHPSSFRYPTYWHVRDYGLFAANPFGLSDFHGDENMDGSHTLSAGESLLLRYRVLLHSGRAEEANVAERFEKYQQLTFE